jgi:hypothetical protein
VTTNSTAVQRMHYAAALAAALAHLRDYETMEPDFGQVRKHLRAAREAAVEAQLRGEGTTESNVWRVRIDRLHSLIVASRKLSSPLGGDDAYAAWDVFTFAVEAMRKDGAL